MSPPGEGVNGTVCVTVNWDPDGAGPLPAELVVGGRFSSVGGMPVNNIAAWDGEVWHAFGAGVDDTVKALTVFGGQLVAGGWFSHAGGSAARRVAIWNGSAWSGFSTGILSTTYQDTSLDVVNALAVYDNHLVAGGSFIWPWVVGLTQWDGSSWQPFMGAISGSEVDCFTLSGSDLYVGGQFNSVGTVNCGAVARWDGTSVHPCNGGDFPYPAWVRSLCVYQGSIYAGGYFLRKWDGANWSWSKQLDPGQVVTSLAVAGGHLYAGGNFVTDNDSSQPRRVAMLSGSSWVGVGSGLGPSIYESGPRTHVRALAEFNSRLYAGGDFVANGNGEPVSGIAFWSGIDWLGLAVPSEVAALTTFGSRVVVGGAFAQATAAGMADHLVAWNGEQFSPLGGGPNGPVSALTGYSDTSFPHDSHLVVGGSFTVAGGVAASHVARWTESTIYPFDWWSALGDGFDGPVRALGWYQGQLVAGGQFSASGATPTSGVARWDGSAWQAMGTGVNGTVRALDAFSVLSKFRFNNLIAGGDFTATSGAPAYRIASWTESVFGAGPWQPMGDGFNATVRAIARFQDVEYAAGDFTLSGSTRVDFIAAWNGTAWVPVGTGSFAGGTDGPIYSLKADGDYLYAAGDFIYADNVPADHVARWDGTVWSAAAGGTDDRVEALTPFHGELLAGGIFTTAGADPSRSLARYLETGVPWLLHQPVSQTKDAGQDAGFSVTQAPGYDGVSFTWRRDSRPLTDGTTFQGSTLSGTSTAALTVRHLAPADSGRYDCVVSNGCGSDTSSAVPLVVTGTTGVAPGDEPGRALALAVRENPARGVAHLDYTLPLDEAATLEIYDVRGRRVSAPIPVPGSAGPHDFSWAGRTEGGGQATAGIYFGRIDAGGRAVTRQFVWLP